MPSDSYDVVVIGAGIGGLTRGAFLARADMRVVVLEKHAKIGGSAHGFAHRGYTFESGIHSVPLARGSWSISRKRPPLPPLNATPAIPRGSCTDPRMTGMFTPRRNGPSTHLSKISIKPATGENLVAEYGMLCRTRIVPQKSSSGTRNPAALHHLLENVAR